MPPATTAEARADGSGAPPGAASPSIATRLPVARLREPAPSVALVGMTIHTEGTVVGLGERARAVAPLVASLDTTAKDDGLRAAAERLVADTDHLMEANASDVEKGRRRGDQPDSGGSSPSGWAQGRGDGLRLAAGGRPLRPGGQGDRILDPA